LVALNQYHGGTNFGRTTGGPFISTSYDYDAPLDEYGMVPIPLSSMLNIRLLQCKPESFACRCCEVFKNGWSSWIRGSLWL